ncbi:response regulator transcription factor [Flavobacteriales bacterium]|nr:response regulator transcription factor [Flavobacteriales bacterium]
MTTTTIGGKRAIVIDDHKLFTSGLCTILESIGLRIVSTFENGRDALYFLKNHNIDLVFSDINMPKLDGLRLCKKIIEEEINTKIIMLSMYEDPNIIKEAFECGANAYLSKNTEKEEIIKAIKKCFANKEYVNKQLFKPHDVMYDDDAFVMKYKLTLREREVLKLMLKEESNQDISEDLNISKRTVETHRKNILLKLGIKNNIGLAKIAVTYNLFN